MKIYITAFLVSVTTALCAQTKITSQEIAKHIGDSVTVCEAVAGGRFLESSSLTLLNMGGTFPNQIFTVVINGKDREKFGKPEETYKGKMICITGKVTEFKSKAQIVVTDPKQVALKE